MFEERPFNAEGAAGPRARHATHVRRSGKRLSVAKAEQARRTVVGSQVRSAPLANMRTLVFPLNVMWNHGRVLSQVVCDSQSSVRSLCGNAGLFT